MSRPVPLQNNFTAGQRQDEPRNRMLPEAVWTLKDFIPGYGAAARGRAGWSHYSSAASAVTSLADHLRGGVFCTFSTTGGGVSEKNLAVDEDGRIYLATEGGMALIGAGHVLAQNPVFMGGAAASAATAVFTGLAIFPDGTGAAVPKKYDGTTLGNLAATTPRARFAAVFKNYLVLANGSAFATSAGSALTAGAVTYRPTRMWFSQIGDPDAAYSDFNQWDLENSWIDFSNPIAMLAATKNALIVFHEGGTMSRVRGNTPPPAEDMEVDDPFQRLGLADPFSVTEYKDNVYWASSSGVYRTDGVVLDDIAKKGGMLRYWSNMMAATASSAYRIATGVLRDYLFVTVTNGTALVDAFIIDMQSYVWTRWSNTDAQSFWPGAYAGADELYFARRGDTRVGRMGSVFQVGVSTYKNDGNGTAVTPTIELPFYEFGGGGLKRARRIFVGYSLTDYGSDDPTVTVASITAVDSTNYVTIGTLSESPTYTRVAIDVNAERAPGYAFRMQQNGAGDFQLHDIELDVRLMEKSKRG